MLYSSYRCKLFPRVRRVNNLPVAQKEKRLQFWLSRSKHLFEQGCYDLAHEYIAMIELNLYLDLDKTDSFRLKAWRMFIMDSRRAFSDYELEKLRLFMKEYK